MQCSFPEGFVDMLVLLTGLLYMLCEGHESEQNSYKLILPAFTCVKKLIGLNGESLRDPTGKAYGPNGQSL